MNVITIYFSKALKTFDFALSMNWPMKAFVFISAFLQPIISPIVVLLILLFVDMNTSVYAQYKDRKIKVSSKTKLCKYSRFKLFWKTIDTDRILDTVDKMIGYSMALAVCLILDRYAYRVEQLSVLSLVSLTNSAFVIIASKEGISILKNISKITNNRDLSKIIQLISKKKTANEG